MKLDTNEVWFIAGSQHLYGDDALKEVAANAHEVVAGLNDTMLPGRIVCKPVLTTTDSIAEICRDADAADNCVGLIAWMHTFSPAKMWITGLRRLAKPLVHLHTQFKRDIPWSTIDMDFMNLNQSAHGGREFGYICSRLRFNRKVVVGHWGDAEVVERLDAWMRAACAWHDAQGARIARIGDNMRNVAVTEGDKVEAEAKLGYVVNGYGVGDVVQFVDQVADVDVDTLCREYDDTYTMASELREGGSRRDDLRVAARIELGLRDFLADGGFKGFTDTFENLHGLRQLPGIAAQRLMEDGYGFGAEGDWKHAALVRAVKVMGAGLEGGASFMEDYTYHFDPAGSLVMGAHMLEICPSIADGKPSCEIHPLGIGGKEDPVRLVFNSRTGPAVNVSIVDVGDRFRMVVNSVDVVAPKEPLPKLPVARALWSPHPDLKTAAASWIQAGGAHHTAFSLAIHAEHLEDFADIAGIEYVLIDRDTTVSGVKQTLRWNEAYFHTRP